MDVTSKINFYTNNDQAKKALLELERQYNDNAVALTKLEKAGKGETKQAKELKGPRGIE